MRADLTFASPELEKDFKRMHAQRNAKLNKQARGRRGERLAARPAQR